MPEQNHGTDPAPSVVFSTLASSRRRRVLRQLLESENGKPLTRLAQHIADDGDSKSMYAELYHTHVPKLEDANFVTYDRDEDEVALVDGGEAIEPFLTLAERYEPVDAPES